MNIEKERKRLKRFVSSTVNERVDLDTPSSKRKKSIKKRKEKKERRKKEKKKEERETFVFKTVCWFNIAGTLKRKKEKRKELFLKSHNYCLVLTY